MSAEDSPPPVAFEDYPLRRAEYLSVAIWLAVRGDPRHGAADEIRGLEREMDRWKK